MFNIFSKTKNKIFSIFPEVGEPPPSPGETMDVLLDDLAAGPFVHMAAEHHLREVPGQQNRLFFFSLVLLFLLAFVWPLMEGVLVASHRADYQVVLEDRGVPRPGVLGFFLPAGQAVPGGDLPPKEVAGLLGDGGETGSPLRVLLLAEPVRPVEVCGDYVAAAMDQAAVGGVGRNRRGELLLVGLELHFEAEVGADAGSFLPNEVDGSAEGPPVLLHEIGYDQGC